MKKTLIVLLILTCTLLCSCSDKSANTPSGSPDGSYPVSEVTDSIKKPLRMIKADGKLYYDSGRPGNIASRCGTLDGILTQAVKEHEIPKNNNECNFEGADGYQNATSITKEVLINGEWMIFKLFDDPELDMSVFDYCYYIKGKTKNAKIKTEIVVLTEDIDYSFADHLRQLGSYIDPDEKKYRTTFRVYGDTDKWGISLSAKDVTKSGLTLMIEQFGGSDVNNLTTGEWFMLEINKNDEWKPLDTNPLIDFAWNDVAYPIVLNDITELKVEWEWLYDKLEPGYYKMKKEIINSGSYGSFDKDLYEVYFEIK